MRRLIAAEFQKLSSTRLWLWILLAAMALTGLFTSLALAFADSPDNNTPPLSSAGGQDTLLSAASACGPLVAVLAAIGLTSEYRHRTATTTFLSTPRRGRVVVAKLATSVLAGAGYALACLATTLAVALPWLASRHIHPPLAERTGTMAGVVAAVAIYGLLGVGAAAVLRDQVATVVVLMGYLFLAEPIVTRISALHGWTIYLPGPAGNALTHVTQRGETLLPHWAGGLLFAGYGLVLAAAGTGLAVRRDIT